jgi:large subunit ribosomal protein L13
VDIGKNTRYFKDTEVEKRWFVVDAQDKVLGRLATEIARILRGKHKPVFTPNADTGDFVIVINAEKVKIAGKRSEMKTYFSYSGYPGGAKTKSFKELIQTRPEFVIHHAVNGMLPHNKLGRRMRKKLKVYSGTEHPHKAQQPVELII